MAKNKTIETKASVKSFLATIKDEKRRSDCAAIVNIMKEQTGHEPKMWGTAIVGFGSYHYKYESGREGDAPMAGLASRVNGIVLYLASEPGEKETLLKNFGKHKVGGGCVYINKLEDIDTTILSKLIKNSIKYYQKKYPG